MEGTSALRGRENGRWERVDLLCLKGSHKMPANWGVNNGTNGEKVAQSRVPMRDVSFLGY